MNISKVSYTQTFNTGNYTSQKISVDVDVNDKEDPKQALAAAKQLVNEFFNEANPQEVMTGTVYNYKEPESVDENDFPKIFTNSLPPYEEEQRPEESMSLADQIRTCTDLKVLDTYKWLVKKDPEAKQAYEEKLEELSLSTVK